ncbi:nuclear transport factor 2 family protein [Kribbella sp. NPDC049227]|uniref:nuclear transport factor 2 family protein n=1 Tax=Kribbella sp. NPDC049227 TaxID=3364113 RepID=UPI00371A670B
MVLTISDGGLTNLQAVVALPRWPEGVSHVVRAGLRDEENAIRDDFTAYGYAFDNRDLETVMGFFAVDCVITNPRGKVSGTAAIRDNYRLLFNYWVSARHFWTNVLVRFVTAGEAYVTAYHYAMLVKDGQTLAVAGTDLRRLAKIDGEWKIVERWITNDLNHVISLYTDAVEKSSEVEELMCEAVD